MTTCSRSLEELRMTDGNYFLGLDLGQMQDYSAVATVDKQGEYGKEICSVVSLKRWPLGTAYPAIYKEVSEKLAGEPLQTAPLIVDSSGVGKAVFDLLAQSVDARRLHGVTITGGQVETRDGNSWNVAKRILVGTTQVLLQSGRLKIAPGLREAQPLVRELQDFRVTITEAANDTYGGRQGAHDDLVLAVALACWGALHKSLSGPFAVLAMGKVKVNMPYGKSSW